jgi:hypothetical protein
MKELGVPELIELLDAHDIDHGDCVDKDDFVELAAMCAKCSPSPPTPPPPPLASPLSLCLADDIHAFRAEFFAIWVTAGFTKRSTSSRITPKTASESSRRTRRWRRPCSRSGPGVLDGLRVPAVNRPALQPYSSLTAAL